MVFQSFNLFAHKTVLENVTLGPIKVRKQSKADAEKRAPRAARPRGRRQPGRQVPGAALRRAAAAGGDRPGAGDGPEGDALRRADVGARPRDDQRGPRRHDLPRPRRHDDGRRHARDGLRPPSRQPRRLHGRRRDRRGRRPRDVLHRLRRPTGRRTSCPRSSPTDHECTARRRTRTCPDARRWPPLFAAAVPRPGRLRRRRRRRRPPPSRRSPRRPEFDAGHDDGRARRGGHDHASARSSTSPASACKNLDGELEGFDVEVAKIIAGALGIAPEDIEFIETHVGRPRGGASRATRSTWSSRRTRSTTSARSGSPSPGRTTSAGQQIMVAADNDDDHRAGVASPRTPTPRCAR